MGCFVDDDGNRLSPEDNPDLYFDSGFVSHDPAIDPDSFMEKAARLAEEFGDFSSLREIFGFGD